ncbi:G/U mismatch-specific DNA glycosylase [Priestia flexa]|nr:G/U mismatch-specific DNA glycosylase [Priestia flexa]
MDLVQDCIKKDLRILFVGFNPSIRSSETGYHFAHPRNRFWSILYKSGLTPRLYKPEEDVDLLDLGYGLTNIVDRPTKAAAEITKEEYEEGRKQLAHKIRTYQPKVVCFVGKGVYEQYSKRRNVPWGIQEVSVIEGTIDFVAPSSSGLVRMKVDDIVVHLPRASRSFLLKEKNRQISLGRRNL